MPTLTAAQLARVQQLVQQSRTGSGYFDLAGYVEGGLRIQPLVRQDGSYGMDAGQPQIVGIVAYPEGQTQVGQPFHLFDTGGNYLGAGQFRDNNISILAGIAMVVGAAFAFTAIGGLTAGGAAGSGSLGAAEGLGAGESLVTNGAASGAATTGAGAAAAGAGGALGTTAGVIGSVAKIAGAVVSLLGLGGGGGAAGGQLQHTYGPGGAGGYVPFQPGGNTGQGASLNPLALAAVGVGLYLLVSR